jgi:tripartite-type tricarboxylate transporter receptor subunit TctC
VVARLNADINAVMQSREMREQLDKLGMEGMGGSPAEAQRFVREETAKWARVAAASGARID